MSRKRRKARKAPAAKKSSPKKAAPKKSSTRTAARMQAIMPEAIDRNIRFQGVDPRRMTQTLSGSVSNNAGGAPGALPDLTNMNPFGQRGNNTDPGFVPGFTEDQKADFVSDADKIARQGGRYGETGYSAPGVDIQSPMKQNRRDTVKDAHIEYLMETKGLSEDDARKESNKRKRNKNFNKMKNFKDWIRDQEDLNLDISRGKIKLDQKYSDGSIDESAPGIRQGVEENNQEAVGMVGDLQTDVAADIRNSLGYRGGIQGNLANLIASSSNPYMFSPSEAHTLEAQRRQALNDYSDIFGDNMRRTIGRMTGQGALNSSLTGQNVKRGAFDSFGDFLVNLDASQSNQMEQFRNNAANRTNQRIQTLTGSGAGLGTTSLSNLYSPFSNVGNLGKMTDAQGAQVAQNQRGQDLSNRQFYDRMRYDARSTPTLHANSPDAGLIDGIFSGASAGSAFGPKGAAAGAVIGGASSFFG